MRAPWGGAVAVSCYGEGVRDRTVDQAADGAAPLSWAQDLVWRHLQEAAAPEIHNRPIGLYIEGRLDVGALRRALLWLVERHDALRLRVGGAPGEPRQWDGGAVVPADEGVGGPRRSQAELERSWSAALAAPIALDGGPPWRWRVDALDGGAHALLIVVHAIAADAWSLRLLTDDLVFAYGECVAGRTPLRPAPAQSYLAFARANRSARVDPGHLDHWVRQLRPGVQRAGLRTSASPGGPLRVAVRLAPSTAGAVAALARARRVTPFATFAAAWQVALRAAGAGSRIALATPVAGRDVRSEAVVGTFTNTVALVGELEDAIAFGDLVAATGRAYYRSHPYQDVPWSMVIDALRDGAGVDPEPCTAWLVFHSEARPTSPLPRGWRPFAFAAAGAVAALTLQVDDGPAGLRIAVHAPAHFDDAAVQELAALVGRVLDEGCAAPAVAVGDLAGAPRHVSIHEAARREDRHALVARIWAEALGVVEVAVDEDLTALGGSSRVALSALARIEAETGVAVPLGVLFSAPTVTGIVAALDRRARAPRPAGELGSRAPLVAARTTGARPPLFLIHHIASNVLYYRDLVRRLPVDLPVYCLQPRGLDGRAPLHHDLREMAADYLEIVRGVQSHGPYRIAGASFGGVVAYEIAQQLLAQGERTSLVGLLDTWAPGYFEYPPGTGPGRQWLYGCVHHLQHCASSFAFRRGFDRWRYVGSLAVKACRGAVAGVVGRRAAPVPELNRRIRAANEEALAGYRVVPYDGHVVLFVGATQPVGVAPSPQLGWERWTERPFEVRTVAGLHHRICREPVVADLAAQLDACLAAVEDPPAGSR